MKLAATRGYGAEVVLYDRLKDNREIIAKKLSEERGLTLVPPSIIRTSSQGKEPRRWSFWRTFPIWIYSSRRSEEAG